MKKLFLLLLCAATLSYAGTLTHRYSFEDDATDSIEFDRADGTLVNGVTIEDGQAVFPGGTGSANENTPIVDFPGKVWRNMDEATLEMWVTPAAGNGGYTPIAYFKGSDGVAVAISAIQRQRPFYGGYIDFDPGSVICDPNVETHFVVTMKGTSFKIYKNGTFFFEGIMNGPIIVPDADGTQCWLGKAQWDHEPAFVGTVNEFRIYNFAISSTTISNNFDDGPDGDPDVPPAPTTYYVSQTGSDSNDGKSPGNAFKTIKHAMDQVISEDTIHVLAGHYTNEYSTGGTLNTNAVPAQRIYAGINDTGFLTDFTLKGDGPDQTFFYNMLDTNNFSDTSPRAFYLCGTDVTLKDFSVIVENYPESGDYAAAFYGWSCTNCTVQNVAVKMTNTGKASGVMFLYGTYCYKNNIMNVLVDGGVCGVFDRFWDLGSGSMHTHDTLIENCTFVNQTVDPASQNFHGYGVAVQTMSNTVVRNCIFQDDERGAVFKQTTPIGGNPATTDITIENTIYHNCPELIVVDNGTDCQTIVHTNAIFNVDPQLQTYQGYPYCSPWGGLGWHGRPFESPVTLNDVAWPLVGNNIQREGNAAVDGIDSDAMILWTNTTQIGPTSSGIWGSPATDETQVYIPVDQYNVEEYTFLSININDGMLNYGVYLDDWCNGAPCVSENMVFSGDVLGNVYGIDKSNGLIIWKTPVGGAVNDCVTLHNNKIYAKGDGVGVKCLNAETGTSLWTNAHGDATTWSGNGPSMNADGSVLYYKVNSGSIRAVDTSDGATLWTFTEGESGNGMTDPIIDDAGNVYCGLNGLSGATEHVVLKLNSSGETEWSYTFGENAWRGGYCLSVDNQTLYVSSQLGLRALNTDDGTLKWTSPDIAVVSGGCAVSQDGIVVGVHLNEGTTSAFAVQDNGTSGTLLWSIPIDTGNGSLSWPCILPNGDVVVATDGGTIVRIGVPEPSLIGCILLGCILMLRRKA